MNINFQSINYVADAKLIEFIKKRIHKITNFNHDIIDVYVYTKVENSSDRINKSVEMKIGIPGNDVIVKKIAKSFEEATNNTSESVERILKRRKEKVRVQG